MHNLRVGDFYHVDIQGIKRHHSIKITAIGETHVLSKGVIYDNVMTPLRGHKYTVESSHTKKEIEEFFVHDSMMNKRDD